MEEDARSTSGLRPLSVPSMASRFPSLRRQEIATEPYRHRSLPPEPSPGSEGSDGTFAVLYDDGHDYHQGHFDDSHSMRSGHGRGDSGASYVPSFRTRDSRVPSEQHPLFENPHEPAYDAPRNPFGDRSQETLAMNTLYNANQDKSRLSAPQSPQDRSQHSHESWCTCDEDHGHHHPGEDMQKDPRRMDLEAQGAPNSPTPLMEKKGPGGPGGPGKPNDDPFLVKFDGPKDPLNPKAWPSSKKWAATAVMASFTFVSPLASSMVAPAIQQIESDFNITSQIQGQIVLSIFVLAYAVGPMILGPLSELYGRVIVLQVSNVLFLAFNLACGFAQTKEQLMAFRFLSGLGGSAPLAIGGGVLGDLFMPEERGKAMGIYAMGPLLGPALGPVVGGWVAQKSTWRWMFWATSIADLFILIAGFFRLRESYAPFILHQKAKALRKKTGDNRYHAEGEAAVDTPVWKKIATTMLRSFKMLFTQPIVQVLALYMAFSYGILYLMLSTYTQLFVNRYGETDIGIAGLNYISLGLGFFIGAPLCGKTNDKIYQKLKARDNLPGARGKPEYRMPLVVPFSLLVPIGLLVYGWSAQAHAPWIIPNIGAFLFGMGTIAAFQCVTTYLVDAYGPFAASAVAAVTILRSLAGFGFPLFGPAMYTALNYGWGNTVLALAAIGIGTPVPILLWLFGEKLRKKSSMTMKKPPGGPGGPGGPGAGKGPGGPGGPMGPGGAGGLGGAGAPPPSGPPPGYNSLGLAAKPLP